MILNILFFIAWTGLVFFIANRRVRELLDIIHKQEERYNDCIGKLKLRSEQNDVLMQTIKILNKNVNYGIKVVTECVDNDFGLKIIFFNFVNF